MVVRRRRHGLCGSGKNATVGNPRSRPCVQAARLLATRAFDPAPPPSQFCETFPIAQRKALTLWRLRDE